METLMETVIQGSTLQTLRAGLRGTAHAPGEEGYEEASRAWNLAAQQTPALVVVAEGDSKSNDSSPSRTATTHTTSSASTATSPPPRRNTKGRKEDRRPSGPRSR
jgi:hypothetical protein